MFKKILIIFIILAIAGGAVVYLMLGKKAQVEYVTAVANRGQLIQTVSETGTIKAAFETDLSFLNSGRVASIYVKIGDKTSKDQILAELDYSDLLISKEEVQAKLDIAEADLDKLKAGATSQEIAVSQANVNQAKTAYDAAIEEQQEVNKTVAEDITQAQKTLDDLIYKTNNDITTYEQAVEVARINLNNTKSTYQQSINNNQETAITTVEDKLTVIGTALDEINDVIEDDDARGVLSIKDFSYLENTNDSYKEAQDLLSIAQNSLATAKTNKINTKINLALGDTTNVLNKTFTSLNYCYSALENSITSSVFTQAELDTFKTNISSQLTLISSAISSIQSEKQDLADAVLDYGTEVAEAEENLAQAQVNLNNEVIKAENALATAKVNADKQKALAKAKVDNAYEAWQVAGAKLAQTKAQARPQDITLARAKVRQAQANLDTVMKNIENSIIKAPIDGTVTKVNYEVGEKTQTATPVISILAENNFEIEVLVSEADIAKVNTNDPAEITLDAFGDDIKFNGRVYFIEPAETIIQDVIYYKVLVEFLTPSPLSAQAGSPSPASSNQADGRISRERGVSKAGLQQQDKNGGAGAPPSADYNIKSGMTANITIITEQNDNVLLIPTRAIVEKNGGDKMIRILSGGQMTELPIKIGLRGDEGMIEVRSGVKEGDVVVTSVKEKK